MFKATHILNPNIRISEKSVHEYTCIAMITTNVIGSPLYVPDSQALMYGVSNCILRFDLESP